MGMLKNTKGICSKGEVENFALHKPGRTNSDPLAWRCSRKQCRHFLSLRKPIYISAATAIHSVCWKPYACLPNHGYVHHVFNHSKEFITADGAHTNNIESRWHALKLSLPCTGNYCFNKMLGTQKHLRAILPKIFSEKSNFLFFKNRYLSNANNIFCDFLKKISRIYEFFFICCESFK
ncbi:hypothetical protein HZS_4045 [Henneguya salminicola]|nr:hypothetical protein HZS_4045 [Henneguya salminicola]